MQQPSLTLGVEEEYQIVDPRNRALRSYITRILEQEHGEEAALKPELHQSMVEVGTPVCRTPADVRRELIRLRGTVMGLLERDGLTIVSAGSHPFSHWWEQEITPLARYIGVKADMGDLAHRLLIFGMHVHVGIEDHELAIDVVNCARYFLPHLLALSTSSPFWIGRNTGLKSYRSTIFRSFPRTGIPTRMSGWSEYQGYLDTLTETGCIPNGSKIWWDVRPHWKFPTVEFRVCDACTRVDEAVCIAAIVQALAFKLWKLRRDNMMWRDYSSRLIEENKWRAMRFGLGGNLIDFGKRRERPAPELISEFIDWFLADAADELGTRREIDYAHRILAEGSSADRQLATFERTGSLEAVVDQLITETAQDVTPIAVTRPVETGVAHVRHTLGDTIAVELARVDATPHAEGTSDARGRAVPVAIETATLAAAAERGDELRDHDREGNDGGHGGTTGGGNGGAAQARRGDAPRENGRDGGDRAPVLP